MKETQRGFSLIEVLITSVIIGIVSAIVVVRYGSFNSSVLLKNQAYEIALAVREAQVFSISTRGQSDEFRNEYGVYFSGVPSQEFIVFLDSGSVDDEYDTGDAAIETFLIDSRFKISDLCLTTVAGTDECVSTGDITDLSAMFFRPDFDAVLRGDGETTATKIQASIVLSTKNDGPVTREIVISAAGQISVQTPTP